MQKTKLTLIITVIAITLAACSGNQAAQTPTVSVSDIQTLAVAAFVSGLTETAQAMPTEVPIDTPAPTNTIVTFNTFVPLNGSGTPITAVSTISSPTASCYGLLYIKDVSIPDDTKMQPGKKFTKTWMVQNTGGCAWQAGFKWTLISGDPMGGSTVTLTQPVTPGDQYQISVPMIAPNHSWRSNRNMENVGCKRHVLRPIRVGKNRMEGATERPILQRHNTPEDTATP